MGEFAVACHPRGQAEAAANGIAGNSICFVQCRSRERFAGHCLFTDETVSEVLFSKPESTLSSGFVGTIICWFFGIALTALAVLIALNGATSERIAGLVVLCAGASICGWARTAQAAWRLRLAAILLGCTMLLLISEIALRNMTNYPGPAAARFVPHTSLGFVLDPASNGVDGSGFPNPAIPSEVDVVTIGDIQTAGTCLAFEESWPAVFGQSTGQTVYNLAVPGYGPAQYEQLIDKAIALKPRQVIVGLNISTDLNDTAMGISPKNSVNSSPETFVQKLSRLSAIAGLTKASVLKAWKTPQTQIQIGHSKNPIAFSPQQIESRSAAFNLKDDQVKQAFLKTVSMLGLASEKCRQSGAALTVLLIPPPEFVCGQAVSLDQLPPALQPLLDQQASIRDNLLLMLNSKNVFTVDAFPAVLKTVSEQDGIYSKDAPDLPTVGLCRALANALSQTGSVATN